MRISDWSSDVCSSDLYDFPQKAFDMAISRFGVMFFGDSVGAFANIRCAMVPGGALHAIVWRGPRENGFMTTAERAAAPPLPALPPPKPAAPGQPIGRASGRGRGWKYV